MKKFISFIAAASIATVSAVALAADIPSVYLNGEKLSFEVNPFIKEERTLVPMRTIFEAEGAEVKWDDETKTVVAAKNNADGEPLFVTLQIDNKTAYVNGESIELDVPAEIVDGTTFVPLRFISESLGADVSWDNDNYSVIITSK